MNDPMTRDMPFRHPPSTRPPRGRALQPARLPQATLLPRRFLTAALLALALAACGKGADKPAIDAAKRAGVRHVVLLSAMGANADPSAPMRQAELHLEQSGLAWNTLRPNWFMQNFHTFWLPAIQATGNILLPVGSAKGSFIDTRDIAAVAAALLTGEAWRNQDFDLTGPEALDHDQVARILSDAAGRSIGYQDIPPEAMRSALLGAGLPADYTEFMLVILGFFKAGYAERITGAVQQITGRAPRTLAQYAADHRSAWQA